MIDSLQLIITKKVSNPRGIFLIDGIGAIVSALFLIVLSYFETTFGMPGKILHYLMFPVLIFASYSLLCHLLKVKNWKAFLKVIALGNMCYGLITLFLIFYLYNELRIWGISYFLIELLVLAILVQLEFKIAFQKS